MATSSSKMNLPKGFVLEEEAPPQSSTPNLPKGFVLEDTSSNVPFNEGKEGFMASAKKLLPTKEQLPELIGTTVGAMAGEIPGIMLGGMAGRAALQFGQRKGIFKGTPPKDSVNAAGEILNAGRLGAMSELGGQLVNKVTGKLFAPFASAVTPESLAAKTAAESAGIELPIGNITTSKPLQVFERGLEYSPFGQVITKQRQKALEGLDTYAKTLGDKLAVNRLPEVAGNFVKEGLNGIQQSYHDATSQLYDSVMPLIKQANPEVEVGRTVSAIDNTIKNRGGALEPAGLKMLKDLRKDLVPDAEALFRAQSGMFSKPEASINAFEKLKNARTNLGLRTKFGDPASAGLENDLKGIYGAMTEDMNATVKKVSQGAFDDLQKASDMNAEMMTTLKSGLYKQIISAKPENVYKLIIQPGTAGKSQAEIGRELVGDQFKDVARQWWNDIVKRSSPDGQIIPSKLSRYLKDYENVIPVISEGNPELASQFTKLKQISTAMKSNQATGGSQTGYALEAGTLVGATAKAIYDLLSGNYGTAGMVGAGIAGSGLGVASLKSQIGRKLLTTGLPVGKIAGNIAGRSTQIGTQLGLQKSTE